MMALHLKASKVFTKEILLCLCNKKVNKKYKQRRKNSSNEKNIKPDLRTNNKPVSDAAPPANNVQSLSSVRPALVHKHIDLSCCVSDGHGHPCHD